MRNGAFKYFSGPNAVDIRAILEQMIAAARFCPINVIYTTHKRFHFFRLFGVLLLRGWVEICPGYTRDYECDNCDGTNQTFLFAT
ncbi:MAG: hypothetical protein IPH31_14375 [Lewinellaceae bacterium]|nr:hypothetical protein [Lewinellaceae bacterium]